jgi:hypothetical protein
VLPARARVSLHDHPKDRTRETRRIDFLLPLYGYYAHRSVRSGIIVTVISEGLRSSTDLLADADVPGWHEESVPIETRGVSLSWLTRFVDDVQSYVNRGVQAPPEFFRSKKFTPAREVPVPVDASVYRFLNTHGLVSQIVKPLTEATRAPLFAFVPEKFRGRPDNFVSHTWNSLLRGPERQRIGTIDALCDMATGDKDTYVWIDFICYNQHVVASISNDMCEVIATIGSLLIAATPTPLFTRSWCLWELLSAHRFGATIDFRVLSSGYRNDKILAVNSLYRSFRGIENARSVSARDQAEIYDGLVAYFGSGGAANEGIQKLVEEKFADPWFELQPRAPGLQYSPLPWVWTQARRSERSASPFFLSSLLASGLLGSDWSVGELFKESGLKVVAPAQLDEIIDSRQVVDEDATLRGVKIADTPKGDKQQIIGVDMQVVKWASDESPLNSTTFRMTCPGCGRAVEYLNRPRYFYSEAPGSQWDDFLGGLPLNRCACGLAMGGCVSSFHTLSWTAVTLEPPKGRALAAETFAALAEEVLTGIRLFPPLLLFQSFGAIQQAVARGTSQPFLLIPFSSLIYRDVSETQRALRVLIAKAVSARLFSDAYLFIKNAAAIHPDLFWVFFDEARQFAQIVDEASTGGPSLLNDFESVNQHLAGSRRVPSLDRKAVFVCFGEDAEGSGPSGEQIYYALRGYFDAHQDLRFLAGEKACSSLPSWLLPKAALPAAHKCLLDVHICAAGEFLLRHDSAGSQAIAMELRQARERIQNRYSDLSRAQQAQVRKFYYTVGGRDLLDLIGNQVP